MKKSLIHMKEGETARVTHLKSKGAIRRRFLDLGIVAGTKIQCTQRSAFGDPIAYEIRGAVIALRKEDAMHIYISE